MGALLFSQAGLTRAIENDFVIFDPKSRRRHRFDTGQASFQFEDPATHAAKEVMMMAFVGAFVTRHLARDLHGNHAAVLGERLEGTIDRCYSKSRDFPNCEALNFWRGQRIVVLLKHGLNGPLLSRASFHASKDKGVEERDQRPDNFLSMFHRFHTSLRILLIRLVTFSGGNNLHLVAANVARIVGSDRRKRRDAGRFSRTFGHRFIFS